MTPEDVPKERNARLPRLARWMLERSLRAKVRDEGLAAFEEEFNEKLADTGHLSATRRWAIRVAWELFHEEYKPVFEIATYILAVLGVVLGTIGLM